MLSFVQKFILESGGKPDVKIEFRANVWLFFFFLNE